MPLMAYKKNHILGVYAPAPRVTLGAALLLALALAVPVSLVLTLIDMAL